ncbi:MULTISPECIES: serine hydrolase [unclassified Streptomyces]|uniref:serine hydrolase n=1 Tax=unclassified Streptomyces TaxID=2593676 RepID=UPI00382D4621
MRFSRASAGASPGPRGSGRRVLHSVLAVATVLGVSAGGTVFVRAQAHPGRAAAVSSSGSAQVPGSSPRTTSPATSSATSSAAPRVTVEAGGAGGEARVGAGAEAAVGVDRDALLAAAMEKVSVPDGARVSLAVLDPASGERAGFGAGSFDTASIVKVDILAALLLRAQDADRELTATERTYAAAMIRRSDNDAASALWKVIGEADGLDAANERLGLTGTEGGRDLLWGLTQTTAADQLTLLEQVFGTDSALDADSRAYLRKLMGSIVEGQRWGVSAAADGSAWALKNGWLPRTATGLWDVNSIGRVTSGGRELLVAVLSDRSVSQEKGIALVEAAAKAAVSVFAPAATATD